MISLTATEQGDLESEITKDGISCCRVAGNTVVDNLYTIFITFHYYYSKKTDVNTFICFSRH